MRSPTLACLRPQSIEPSFNIRLAAIAITIIILGGLAVYLIRRARKAVLVAARPENDAGHFLNFATIALGLLAITAMLWVTLPTFMITDCRA